MTVFFPPLYPEESRIATLFVTARRDSSSSSSSSSSSFLRPAPNASPAPQTCDIQEYTWHCTFRIDNLVTTRDYIYRVNYQPAARRSSSGGPSISLKNSYYGMIPKQALYPKIVALGCFGPDSTWQKNELVQAVLAQNPDLLLLQGDQVYGKDNLAHGILELVYSIQIITRRMPTVVQLDDHDYGMGNLWGAGQSQDEDSGAGFWESQKPVCIINALQDLATSHMPDSVAKNNKRLDNGMGILYTSYNYGNVDFAVLEARKFSLLGSEQEEWLRGWCSSSNNNNNNNNNSDENNASAQAPPRRLKVVLAQTPFAALTTNVTNYYQKRLQPVSGSNDTNAYPPAGRRRFMEIVQNCSPLVLSGDQHLGIAVTYEDYGVSECASPAAINDIL
jgi:phosphodiesterase/alkaline phosphatase D-like protein